MARSVAVCPPALQRLGFGPGRSHGHHIYTEICYQAMLVQSKCIQTSSKQVWRDDTSAVDDGHYSELAQLQFVLSMA